MESRESGEKLIPFLRDLADSIERQDLPPRLLESIGDFFMSYQFQQQAIKDLDDSNKTQGRFSKDDLIKFFTLGWYVYQVLLRQESLEINTDSDDSE
jgi:hypothetical protein